MVSAMYRLVMRWVTDGSGGSGLNEDEFGTWAVILNAGIMALPERTVRHGLELQFLTNHMGHFILVTGAMDALGANRATLMVQLPLALKMAEQHHAQQAAGQDDLFNVIEAEPHFFQQGLTATEYGTLGSNQVLYINLS